LNAVALMAHSTGCMISAASNTAPRLGAKADDLSKLPALQ